MTDSNNNTIKTAFHDFHVAQGARMVDFAGFRMPIQYKGITSEHLAVRENVGLFDLSHMGEFEVSGPDAEAFLQKVTTNNVAALQDGQIQYSCMTLPTGGIVDDLLVYKMPTRFMLVVNASNLAKDFKWLQDNLSGKVRLTDRSADTSLLAIQGPKAQKVMERITDYDLDSMGYYTWALAEVGGQEMLFSRTGYTGEDGFELYIAPEQTTKALRTVVDAGKRENMAYIGLGARDSLRLEMKMALYGNDIDETTTPVEAGLSWIVEFEKEFIGRDILAKQRDEKPKRRLVCLEFDDKVIPRHGYPIVDGDKEIGVVTSGVFSPSLQKAIAMGYVPRDLSKAGSTVEVDIRGKRSTATVVKPPFYKNASHR